MPIDCLGHAVTGADAMALASVDDFVMGLISYETRAAAIVDAAKHHPAVPIVQTYAGFLHLLGENAGAADAARPFLDAARAASGPNARERALIDALAAWIADEINTVIVILDRVLAEHPSDLATLKLLHYHLFNRGDFPAMLKAAVRSAEAGPSLPYVHGMAAFAYEQLHLLCDAEAAARRALATVPDDPWAQHALAHVMLTEGRIEAGVAMLEDAAPGWRGLNSFMITHLWWHLALFYLSQGREADALAAYDEQVWAVAKDYSQDQIGAASLLARLELAGIGVGERWGNLGTYLTARAEDVVQPFLTVQYLYGLARARRPEAARLLEAIEHVAENGPDHSRAVWHDVALPLAYGLMAHAEGDFDTATALLTETLPRLVHIGGSHAQRDLFDLILLDARIRSGRLIDAQQTLELRRAHDPSGAVVNRQLAEVYAALGLPAQAAEAKARIGHTA